jgi:hypothetical protein
LRGNITRYISDIKFSLDVVGLQSFDHFEHLKLLQYLGGVVLIKVSVRHKILGMSSVSISKLVSSFFFDSSSILNSLGGESNLKPEFLFFFLGLGFLNLFCGLLVTSAYFFLSFDRDREYLRLERSSDSLLTTVLPSFMGFGFLSIPGAPVFFVVL